MNSFKYYINKKWYYKNNQINKLNIYTLKNLLYCNKFFLLEINKKKIKNKLKIL